MQRRYLRSNLDLPDHDLILGLSSTPSGLTCHVRHYVHGDTHLVIVGQLPGGISPIASAVSVAREVAEVVIPPGQEFAMVTYAPQSPLSGESQFHEVRFEIDSRMKRPSSAVFEGPEVALPCFESLDLPAVEALAGRPVLTFPYGFYTTPTNTLDRANGAIWIKLNSGVRAIVEQTKTEREGFEPSNEVNPRYAISSRAHSTALAPLH
jgi:hypothetical protein